MPNREENKAIIEVKGLKKAFDDLLVLDKISFCVNKGEILSILGPSGSGKTTLLKCLIGLETLNSSDDSVIINGLNRNDYLSKNRIAYVPQRYSNYPWLNVFENIKLGMINHESSSRDFNLAPIHLPALKVTEEEKQRRSLNQKQEQKVREIIDVVGLTGFEKYTIDKLSGGMQQRVAIGRAIAQNTDIIAMDEPFGALDFKIRENLQLLVKRLNKTVLFVTHDIEEALFIADKLIVLSKTPTSITNDYKLTFRQNMDPAVKFEQGFINYRREIQLNLTQAEDLIKEMRNTGKITSLPVQKILTFPFLDALRNQVNEETDRETILNLVKSNESDFQIGVMLLRKFKEDDELNRVLLNRFHSNHLTDKSKFFLMHELSYRVSDRKEREKMWDFIKEHFAEYKAWEVEEYFPGKQGTIEGCRHRLYKPEHKNKVWVYLVTLAGTELQEAKEIIETYVNDDDKFVSDIARELIKNTKWN